MHAITATSTQSPQRFCAPPNAPAGKQEASIWKQTAGRDPDQAFSEVITARLKGHALSYEDFWARVGGVVGLAAGCTRRARNRNLPRATTLRLLLCCAFACVRASETMATRH